MNEFAVVRRSAEWQRVKTLVLDSVSSTITKRVYNRALDEFFAWYELEPRRRVLQGDRQCVAGLAKDRRLGSSSIIVRMSAIRKLAAEAADNGILAPELAVGRMPA